MEGDLRKIGILGGTFDPIHNGHLAIAESAAERLGLDGVIFIPAGRPWLKAAQVVSDPSHRLEMTRRAVAGHPRFEVSDVEIERPGPTYTVDTLRELRARFTDSPQPTELYLILGMDSARDLERWRSPERIFEMCVVVALSRPGSDDARPDDIERRFPAARGRFQIIQGPQIDISATQIRQSVAAGRSIGSQVPPSVEEYIREWGLYRAS